MVTGAHITGSNGRHVGHLKKIFHVLPPDGTRAHAWLFAELLNADRWAVFWTYRDTGALSFPFGQYPMA